MAINISAHSHLFALDNGNYLIFTGSIGHETIALMNCVISFGRPKESPIEWKVKWQRGKYKGAAIAVVIEWRLAKPNRSFMSLF